MKRFRLLRYYVIISFVVIAIGAIVLAFLLNIRAEDDFIARSEEQGSTEVGHTLQMFYYNVLAPRLEAEADLSIREVVNPDMLDMFARRTTFGLNVTGIHMYDPEGNLVYSSEPEDVAHVEHGADDDIGINESDRPLLLQALEGTPSSNLMTDTEITDLEGNTRTADAVLSYTAITDAAPDSGQDGRVLGVLSISQDVTEAFTGAKSDALRNSIIASVGPGVGLFLVLFLVVLRADTTIAAGHRRIEAQQEALEREVGERKQAEEALRRSNADLEEFTYSVSHDLKEPLRGIEAFAAFLAEDYKDHLDEQGMRYIEILQDSSVRMKHLIEDLLEISRVGRVQETRVATGVGLLLEDLRRDLNFTLQEKNVDLRIQPDLPTITCEEIRIRKVFQNLISNAIKFNDKAQPVIEIACSQSDGTTTFSVRDNGIGIDDQYYDQIFSVFQRLNRREDYEGTGVGLALCKKIVEGYGGRMWVESKPGEGSTFLFTIPQATQAEAQAPEQSEATIGSEQSSNEGARSPKEAGSNKATVYPLSGGREGSLVPGSDEAGTVNATDGHAQTTAPERLTLVSKSTATAGDGIESAGAVMVAAESAWADGEMARGLEAEPPARQGKMRAFLAEYSRHGIVTSAAESAGIRRSTHYRWLESSPAYKVAVRQAAETAVDRPWAIEEGEAR